MADITVRNQGEVDDSGKVNWRGDQVSVPQGGQSIYKTSSIKLAQLGSRKVVGDRVFRYALSAGTIPAGNVAEFSGAETLVDIQPCGTSTAGSKVVSMYATTDYAKNAYAEGYLMAASSAPALAGCMYRIKTNDFVTSGTVGSF